jgi:hypothetical protein
MVGARCACPISGAKHRAPTIETIVSETFYEIIKNRCLGNGGGEVFYFLSGWLNGAHPSFYSCNLLKSFTFWEK